MIKNIVLEDGALQILESGNRYGNMNTEKAFYPEDYTREMRWSEFLRRRLQFGEENGFDGRKMFMANQKDKNGSWFEITRDYVEANPNGWSDIPEDILIVTHRTPGVVIGHPVADCPVVMAYDVRHKALAIGHCSAALIDKKMPMLVIDALKESKATSEDDIVAYVSACAGKSWTYDCYPAWARDFRMWEDAITLGKDGMYHIDLKKVVLKQLYEAGIGAIVASQVDTITNPDFYSNSAARYDPEKRGRHFAGGFFR